VKPVWSDDAGRDVDSIWEYIAADNIEAADELIATLQRAADRLGDFPLLGRMGLQKGTRELVVAGTPYILIYRFTGKTLEILRALHGAQKWPPGED
jgi:toxin ParE1/3/4